MDKVDKYLKENNNLNERFQDPLVIMQKIITETMKLEGVLNKYKVRSLLKYTNNIRKQIDIIKTRLKRETTPE